jgi:hypothetical protein
LLRSHFGFDSCLRLLGGRRRHFSLETMTDVDAFFVRYAQSANSFDPDPVLSVAQFRAALPARREFMQGIGFRFAKMLDVAATPLDKRYTTAKVHWHLRFEKTPGAPQDFRFHITYFLFDPGSGTGPKVAFYISHEDEQQVMREAGLLPG